MSAIPEPTLGWVHAALGRGSRVLAVDDLPEASHTNHRVRAESASGTELDLLLRRFTDFERLTSDLWYSPADELAAIRALAEVDLPVPRLVAEDTRADVCDVPTLLLSWLDGDAPAPDDLEAFAAGLAEPLPAIHAVEAPTGMRTYEPYFVSDGIAVADLRPPSWALEARTWERAFEVVAAGAPETPSRFIHRDYHHGNTVWRDDRLTGIVDWTTGCLGPPGIDLAQARINLAWDHDQAAADTFLRAWRSLEPGMDADPYWDVLDAVDWLGVYPPDPSVSPEALRRYEAFVERALAQLG